MNVIKFVVSLSMLTAINVAFAAPKNQYLEIRDQYTLVMRAEAGLFQLREILKKGGWMEYQKYLGKRLNNLDDLLVGCRGRTNCAQMAWQNANTTFELAVNTCRIDVIEAHAEQLQAAMLPELNRLLESKLVEGASHREMWTVTTRAQKVVLDADQALKADPNSSEQAAKVFELKRQYAHTLMTSEKSGQLKIEYKTASQAVQVPILDELALKKEIDGCTAKMAKAKKPSQDNSAQESEETPAAPATRESR
jgi:hypothetical protein